MQTSKHLITALEKSDWLDRMLILAALVFFILVVLFIVQQRVVNRGLRVAFWWTRFLPIGSRGEDKVVEMMEKGSARVSSVVASTATAFATALATSATSTLLPPVPSVSDVPESPHGSSLQSPGELSGSMISLIGTPSDEVPFFRTTSASTAEADAQSAQHDEL